MLVGADHRIDFGVDCHEPLQDVLVGGVCHFRSNHAAVTVFHAHRSRLADGATSGVKLLGLVLVAVLSFASERHDPSDPVADAWDVWVRRLTDSLDDGIHLIPCFDVRCRERLREINDPPVVPSVKSDVEALHGNRSIAIVGTRQPTPFGERAAPNAGKTASVARTAVVGGSALGCDSKTHESCVAADGTGMAVSAHGLDRVHPGRQSQASGRKFGTRRVYGERTSGWCQAGSPGFRIP